MLAYKLALTSVNFDDTYNNSIRFNSRAEQEQYFKVDDLFRNATYVNFNVDSLIRTTLTYVSRSDDMSSLMNYNYCIVKDTRDNASRRYYYYFVKETKFNNDRQVQLRVELDVLNTYLLDITFDNCLIERAHLSRFTELTPDTVTFDWGNQSPLYSREPIQSNGLILSDRRPVFINPTGLVNFDEWLNYQAPVWCYVFLSIKNDGYKFYKDTGEVTVKNPFLYRYKNTSFGENYQESPYIVLAYPVKSNADFKCSVGGNTFTINYDGLTEFLNNNGGFANVLTMKVSTLPPFAAGDYSGLQYNIDSNDSLIYKVYGFKNVSLYNATSGSSRGVMLVHFQDFDRRLQCKGSINIENTFTKEEIRLNKDLRFNPKLYNFDYFKIRLTNGVNSFDYDASKLFADSEINLELTEVISPDITKSYLRIVPSDASCYPIAVADNFSGLVSNLDYSMPYSKNNLDVYLSNNKNFFMQKIAQTGTIAAGGIMGAVAASNPITMGVAVGGAAVGMISNAINAGLQVDNLKSSPEQLAQSNGNGVFNIAVTDCRNYVEQYELLMSDKLILDDYMHLYGFVYNRFDNINNVINIRKNFNYVKAKVDTIKSDIPISNEVRTIIKQIFNNGITFWNVTDDIFNHNVPNYERWLDN